MRQETRGPSGDVRVDYVRRGKYWASFAGITGRELAAAGQDTPQWEARFNVRFSAAILPTDKVVFAGVRYDIVALNPLGRNVELEILATKDVQRSA